MVGRFSVFLLPVLLALTGCGTWVVFGHTIGEHSPPADQSDAGRAKTAPADHPDAAGTGSAQAHAAPAQARTGQARPALVPRIKAVSVVLTAQGKDKVSADPRFDTGALLTTVTKELAARKLLAPGDPGVAGPLVEIQVDDFDTHRTVNAVVFGYIFSAGTLAGDIKVRDSDGKELRAFRIAASSQMRNSASGEDADPLGALYRKFARLTADDLAGTPGKSEDSSGDATPR